MDLSHLRWHPLGQNSRHTTLFVTHKHYLLPSFTTIMGLLEESKAQAEILAGKGYDLCKYGKYKEALEFYRQACTLDADNFKYWYNAAVACDRIGDNAGMERACLKTIECDGSFIKGYVRLAKAHVRQEKWEEASEVIATGMLIHADSPELKALKEQVDKKQEEKSMIAARQLEQRLQQQQRTADPPERRGSDASQRSGVSYGSTSGSAVTAIGGNVAASPTRSPVTQKPNHVVNLLQNKRGGIPPQQREIPKLNNPQYAAPAAVAAPKREIPRLNNPHFGDSAPAAPKRDIPRLNNANFGDSAPHHRNLAAHHAPRLAIPPNRDNGPDFKDQCKTFIVAEAAVKEMNPQEAAPKPAAKPARRLPFFRKQEHEL